MAVRIPKCSFDSVRRLNVMPCAVLSSFTKRLMNSKATLHASPQSGLGGRVTGHQGHWS